MIRFVVVIRAKCKVVTLAFVLFFLLLLFVLKWEESLRRWTLTMFYIFHVSFYFKTIRTIHNSTWFSTRYFIYTYIYSRLIFWYRCVRHEDATDGSKHDVRAPMQEKERKNFSRSHERHTMLHATCTWPRDLRCNSTISLRRRIFSPLPSFPCGCTLQDVARHETGD